MRLQFLFVVIIENGGDLKMLGMLVLMLVLLWDQLYCTVEYVIFAVSYLCDFDDLKFSCIFV